MKWNREKLRSLEHGETVVCFVRCLAHQSGATRTYTKLAAELMMLNSKCPGSMRLNQSQTTHIPSISFPRLLERLLLCAGCWTGWVLFFFFVISTFP